MFLTLLCDFFVVLFSFWSGVVLPVGFQLWKQIMFMNSVWRKEEIIGEHRVEARSWGRGGRNCRIGWLSGKSLTGRFGFREHVLPATSGLFG